MESLQSRFESITSRSFIKTIPLDFTIQENFNWIFFSSSKCVEYYLEKYAIPQSTKIAVVGPATNNTLQDYGYEADFIGDISNLNQSSKDFKSIVKKTNVLFPQSNLSVKRFENYLSPEQIICKIIYTTESDSVKLNSHFDLIFFTSPSNVKSYFKLNKIDLSTTYISIGPSTSQEIIKHSIANLIEVNTNWLSFIQNH